MANQEQIPQQQDPQDQPQRPPSPIPFTPAKQVGFNLEDIILNTNNEGSLLDLQSNIRNTYLSSGTHPKHLRTLRFYSLLPLVVVVSNNCVWGGSLCQRNSQKSFLPPRWRLLMAQIILYLRDKPVVFKAPKTSSKVDKKDSKGKKLGAKTRSNKIQTGSKSKETKDGSSKVPTGSQSSHFKTVSSSALDTKPSQPSASTPIDDGMHNEDQHATGSPTSLGVTREKEPTLNSVVSAFGRDASVDSTTKANSGKSAPHYSIHQQQGRDEGTKNYTLDHIFAGTNLNVLADKTKSISEGNMNTTQAQQKALDDALVAPMDRLEFDKCNMRLKTDIKPKEATFQVVLDVLALIPFYQAFLIDAEVLGIYMQEFWATISVHKQKFEDLLWEHDILSFIRHLGQSGDIIYLSDVNIDYLHQPWRAFVTIELLAEERTANINTQSTQYSVIHQPPQETSLDFLQDNRNLINYVQTFLGNFKQFSFYETPKVVSLAWETISEIKHAFKDKQYQPDGILELFCKLHDDVQNIHEELAEYIDTPSWNRPTIYCDDDDDDDDEDYIIAIIPDLPITDSLIMEDEHLDTIPAMESDELIKSSVENLVQIPSESEGIPDNMCDVPFRDNSPPLDISKDQFEGFSDSNDDSTSIDDDSFSIDDIDYVEASPPDSELVSLEVVEIVIPEVGGIDTDILLTIKDDILREKLLNVDLLLLKFEALKG
ncbi:hypothetical protein Tco_0190446 [Tanacetum coccineum]